MPLHTESRSPRVDRTKAEWQAAIVEEARSWLGTPYHHEACLKDIGVDCVYLLIAVYSAVGLIEPFKPAHYPRDWHLHRSEERYLQGIARYCVPCEPPWEVGDVLTYTVGRCVSHAGVYVGDNMIIHSLSGRSVEASDMRSEWLASRFAGGWRLRWLFLSS